MMLQCSATAAIAGVVFVAATAATAGVKVAETMATLDGKTLVSRTLLTSSEHWAALARFTGVTGATVGAGVEPPPQPNTNAGNKTIATIFTLARKEVVIRPPSMK
jgi:hypothetical protein